MTENFCLLIAGSDKSQQIIGSLQSPQAAAAGEQNEVMTGNHSTLLPSIELSSNHSPRTLPDCVLTQSNSVFLRLQETQAQPGSPDNKKMDKGMLVCRVSNTLENNNKGARRRFEVNHKRDSPGSRQQIASLSPRQSLSVPHLQQLCRIVAVLSAFSFPVGTRPPPLPEHTCRHRCRKEWAGPAGCLPVRLSLRPQRCVSRPPAACLRFRSSPPLQARLFRFVPPLQFRGHV